MPPDTLSQQPRLSNTQETLPYILTMWQQTEDIPAWGSPGRAAKLREFARTEPILSGALSSMVSKACSLDWQLVGGRNRVQRYQTMLAEAEDGKGWQSFLSRYGQDYLNTDQGGFAELGRQGQNGPVGGIYHMDAECIGFTGNVNYPYVYTPKLTSGKLMKKSSVSLRALDVARISDMESPDETKYSMGWCAVSRAVKAARVLLALYNYDEEKLADMPMPGLVTITGMTMDEVDAAFKLYQAHRDSKQQAVFKGLLWLASQSSPLHGIEAKLVSFAGLPENFDREQTFSLYIYTLALVFGVDAREFWPATQSGATKGEAEVQAQKAKGKGFGQMLAAIKRAIDWSVLPEGIEFDFHGANDDDDLAREIWRGQAIKNVRTLWEPSPATGQGLVTTEEARKMLVGLQAAPDWLSPSEEITLSSGDRELPQEDTSLETPMDQQEQQEQKQAQQDQKIAQQVARAKLEPGEPLVAAKSCGDIEVLWLPRSYHEVKLPLSLQSKGRRDAAIAHLQAAGLIITEGATELTPEPIPVSMPDTTFIAQIKDLRASVLAVLSNGDGHE